MSKYLFVGDAHSNIFIGEHDQKSLEAISPGNMNSDAGVAWRTFHDPAPVSLSDPSPALLPCNLRSEFYRLELDPGRSLNSECPLPSPFPRPLELGSGHFLPFPRATSFPSLSAPSPANVSFVWPAFSAHFSRTFAPLFCRGAFTCLSCT